MALVHARLVMGLVLALGVGCTANAREEKGSGAGQRYAIETTASPSQVSIEGKGTYNLVIRPEKGYKVHPEAPLRIRLSGEKIAVEKAELAQADGKGEEKGLRFSVPFQAGTEAGLGKISADVSFFLCSDDWCERQVDQVACQVEVK